MHGHTPWRKDEERGVSLAELLVVIAVLALGALVLIPLVTSRVQRIQGQAAAEQLAMSLRAARMVAVTTAQPVTFTVEADPVNRYRFTDTSGRLQEVRLRSGLKIDPASTATLVFQPNGALTGAASETIEAEISAGSVERWVVETALSGIPTVRRE